MITSGDYTMHSTEVEGRTLVGGDLIAAGSVNFGIKLFGEIDPSTYSLQVAGNISDGSPINMVAGSVGLGGSLGSDGSRIINHNGGGSTVSTPGADYSAIFAQLDQASSALAGMAANGVTYSPEFQSNILVFDASAVETAVAIFELGASDLSGGYSSFQLNLPSNVQDVVINVTGTSLNWSSGLHTNDFAGWRSNLIWNFHQAETFEFGAAINGQVLAPNADVRAWQVLEGSIYAKNFETGNEVHLPAYNGNLVPEPGTAVLGLAGCVLLVRRRR